MGALHDSSAPLDTDDGGVGGDIVGVLLAGGKTGKYGCVEDGGEGGHGGHGGTALMSELRVDGTHWGAAVSVCWYSSLFSTYKSLKVCGPFVMSCPESVPHAFLSLLPSPIDAARGLSSLGSSTALRLPTASMPSDGNHLGEPPRILLI